jgi:hypothetical protein
MANWFDILHLDRFVEVTGTYSNPTTTWNIGFTDNTLDAIVLGPDFGASFGDIITPATNSNGVVTFAADHSAGEVIIGRLFPMTVELSREYVRDVNSTAYLDNRATLRELVAMYHQTGALTLKRTMTGRADATVVLDEDPIIERGTLKARFNGDLDQMTLYIQNNTAKPCTIVSLEYILNHRPR